MKGDRTFEASDFWRDVVRRAFFLREYCLHGDGFDVIAWKHSAYAHLVSAPYRDRVALRWCSTPRPLSLDDFRRLTVGRPLLAKDVGSLLALGESAAGADVRQRHTNSSVDLTRDVLARMNRSARKNWRRAREVHQLELRVNPRDAWGDFYSMYLSTRRRLGVIPYPRIFFRALLEGLGQNVLLLEASAAGRRGVRVRHDGPRQHRLHHDAQVPHEHLPRRGRDAGSRPAKSVRRQAGAC